MEFPGLLEEIVLKYRTNRNKKPKTAIRKTTEAGTVNKRSNFLTAS
jgi:hypothetical protein